MKTLLSLLGTLIETLLSACFFILKEAGIVFSHMLKSQPKEQSKYHAAFEDPGMTISRWNRGFSIGSRALTREASFSNAITYGPSGTGKTVNIAINSILNIATTQPDTSLVINAASSEATQLLHAPLLHLGFDILIYDLANPEYSHGYNPLQPSYNDTHAGQKFSHSFLTLSSGPDSKGDKFWLNSSINLFSFCISLLRYFPKEYFHLTNIRQLLLLLSSEPKAIDVTVVRTRSPQLFTEYKAFLSISDNTRHSIIASTSAALFNLGDPGLATITSFDNIHFEQLRKQKTALFITSPSLSTQFNAVLTSLFCEQAYAHLLSTLPTEKDLPVYFILDEISSTSIASLSQALSVTRKYRVGSLLLTQSHAQLEKSYGKHDAQNILANCNTRIFLGNQPPDVAAGLEKSLGQVEYEHNGQSRVRPLMTAQDIQKMKDTAICFTAGKAPCLLHLKPYYKTSFKKYTDMPSIERHIIHTYDQVPLLTKEILMSFQPHGA